ncbi:hypothetical protein [Methanoregula sp.]|uniref:hypothetical protein n=1 Tax=Methanoregula sp. TaxID=2052170 RepID=UPI003C75A7C8
MREQIISITYRKDLLTEAELRSQSAELMGLMIDASRNGNVTDITTLEWKPMNDHDIKKYRFHVAFFPNFFTIFASFKIT